MPRNLPGKFNPNKAIQWGMSILGNGAGNFMNTTMTADNEIYTQLDHITDHLATMTKQERIAWFRRSAYAQPVSYTHLDVYKRQVSRVLCRYRGKECEENRGVYPKSVRGR